jgi:hypothetical protein
VCQKGCIEDGVLEYVSEIALRLHWVEVGGCQRVGVPEGVLVYIEVVPRAVEAKSGCFHGDELTLVIEHIVGA